MLGICSTLLWVAAVTGPSAGLGCPSDKAVAAELDRLGASAALAALGTPEVTVDGANMRVVLRGRDGSVIGTREISAPEACHERASVAAVFVAAWVGEWSTKPMPSLPSRNPATAAPATRDTRPREAAGLSASKVASSVESLSTRPPVVPDQPTSRVPPPAPPPLTTPARPAVRAFARSTQTSTQASRSPTVEVAALAFGTHDGDAGTFGAGVLAAYHFGARLALTALLETTGERETVVGPAIAAYRTSRLGAGASVRRRWGRVYGDASILPELTMLTVNGRQLTSRSLTTWGAAVDVRGRLGLALGRFAPFLFAGGSGALRAERLYLEDRPEATTLSRWNLSIGAGLAVFFGAQE